MRVLCLSMSANAQIAVHDPSARYRVPRPVLLLVRDDGARAPALAPGCRPHRQPPCAPSLPEPEAATSWCEVHERIVCLAAERAALERELCRWLRAAERLAVHVRTGYASLHEYAERILGLTGRQVEERLRAARALAELPALDNALTEGRLSWSAVRELTRVATPETEHAWLAWAKGRSSRQIEQAVAARRAGALPSDRPDPSLVKHRLRFEVRAETMALVRELQSQLRAELGGPMDDDTFLYEVARRALGGPTDEGRASYQVAVTRCPDCRRTAFDAGGQSHAVSSAVAEMVECDCQQIGCVDGIGPLPPTGRALLDGPHVGAAAPEPARPQSASQVRFHDHDRGACPHESPHEGTLPKPLATQSTVRAPARAQSTVRAPARAQSTVRAPARAQSTVRAPARAQSTVRAPARAQSTVRAPARAQTIPPAMRRQVMRRHHGRCAVDGCRNHRFLDVHHVVPRSEGGRHDPNLLTVLCPAHHRAVHFGALVIGGSASRGFTFRHGDGTPYGQPLRPATLELSEQVFGALRELGFGESRARRLIDDVLRQGVPPDLPSFLRAALRAA
jgi:5-methylcytosine-specific restriction endonuclease McrA